jgi:nucleolar protein 12
MRKVCVNTGKLLNEVKRSAQGYVVFESDDSIPAALQMNNTQYQSHTIRVDRATPTIDSNHSVFVGNLPYGADEESLRLHFLTHLKSEEDAAITGVRIIRDRETQKCKGFGYVTFSDASVVPAALELQSSTYMKREIRVMICGKRFKSNRGGGGEKKRSFEGQRATIPEGKKSKREVSASSGGKTKRSRRKSDKKAPTKSGLSKRAATERKVDRRVKKLEKRAAKGMGKKKH